MGKRCRGTITLMIAVMSVVSFSVWAVPPFINYEGKLTDLAGSPMNGTYEMIFYLYDMETNGTALWSEQQSITIADGIFNVRLGAVQPFPAEVFDNNELYLDVTIKKSETEPFEILSPRYRLLSNAFAIKAQDADMVDGKHASELAIGDGHSLDAADSEPTDALYVDDEGKVGIGTSNPFGILEIASSIIRPFLRMSNPGDGGVSWNMYSTNSTYSQGAGKLLIHNDVVGNVTIFDQNGNVGIGTTSPGSYKLNVAGTAYCTSGSWSGSDERWKQDIAPLEGSLDKVNQLQGVSFTWKIDGFPDQGFTSGEQIGLIAQEVEEIIPELVHENDDGYKSISYEKLTAVLVEAIKEQQSQIENLKSQGEELKILVENLAARIELLENR
ncbi:MAG: tail fiber domain-containing protein [bacterium]